MPTRPHSIDTPRVQAMFLEEEDHQRERRVASLRTEFLKLLGGRENECHKGNT